MVKRLACTAIAFLMLFSCGILSSCDNSAENEVQTTQETTGKEAEEEMNSIKIMTCNIWGDYFNNSAEARVEPYRRLFTELKPDVIGIQEYTQGWYDTDLFDSLSDIYNSIGAPGDNFIPLLYRKDKFTCVDSGWGLYGDTNDSSKGLTWAVLSDKETEKKLMVCNTHFWWVEGPEHDKIRCKNAAEMSETINVISKKYNVPAFAFGDLNTTVNTDPINLLLENGFSLMINDAENADRVSSYHFDPERIGEDTFKGSPTEDNYEHSIDHILSYNFSGRVLQYRIVTDQDILDSSDHSPVYVEIEF